MKVSLNQLWLEFDNNFAIDEVPRKKPLTMEEQVARDANGRRRFHGAFTGGFSAGFFNTVGSLEGWRPSEFKSSRNERSVTHNQNPHDFMDDEVDINSFQFFLFEFFRTRESLELLQIG